METLGIEYGTQQPSVQLRPELMTFLQERTLGCGPANTSQLLGAFRSNRIGCTIDIKWRDHPHQTAQYVIEDVRLVGEDIVYLLNRYRGEEPVTLGVLHRFCASTEVTITMKNGVEQGAVLPWPG